MLNSMMKLKHKLVNLLISSYHQDFIVINNYLFLIMFAIANSLLNFHFKLEYQGFASFATSKLMIRVSPTSEEYYRIDLL